jgi:GTP-binding protein
MSTNNTDTIPTLLRSPEFMLGAHTAAQWPTDEGTEIAFAGRSNVGKSSAINAIAGRKNLARTSKTPGRTQQINFFRLDDSRRIVDLPGYGFARVPLEVRDHWERSITQYLAERESLRGLVILMDIRRPLTDLDRQMLDWTGSMGLAVHVLLTKADKLKRGAASSALLRVTRTLTAYTGECTLQLFSSTKRSGVGEARRHIIDWLTEEERNGVQ